MATVAELTTALPYLYGSNVYAWALGEIVLDATYVVPS